LTKRLLKKNTSSYQEDLIKSLSEKTEAAHYLQAAFDKFQMDGDIKMLLQAFRTIAEAQGGLAKLADKTNLNRQSLYKTLSEHGNPKLKTLGLILKGLGFHIIIEPGEDI